MFKIAYYEIKRSIRDRRWLLVFLIQPVLLIGLLGLANRHAPHEIKLAIYNAYQNQYSQKIVDDLKNEKDLTIIEYPTMEAAKKEVEYDRVRGTVIIDVINNNGIIDGQIDYIENSTVPDITAKAKLLCLNATSDTLNRYAKDNFSFKISQESDNQNKKIQAEMEQKLSKTKEEIGKLSLAPQVLVKINNSLDGLEISSPKIATNNKLIKVKINESKNTTKNIKYFDFFASAVIVLMIIIVSLNTSATTISQERIDGTFERFFVTPYTKAQMIVGKMLAYSTTSMALALLTIFSLKMIFEVTIGPLWLVLLTTFITGLAAIALGILISAVTYTIAESVQVSIFVFFAMLILTTFLFQPETMHPSMSFASKVVPFTYSVKTMREINLLNMNFYDIWPNLLIIFGSLIIFLIMAIIVLRRKAD